MFKKILIFAIVGMVLNLATAQIAFADTKEEKFTSRVRTDILKLGTGPDAKIDVKLKDKSKIKGYVSEANNEQVVIMSEAGVKVPVSYPQVRQVRGNNLSEGVKILIGVGVAIAFIIFAASQLK